jgi:hypothetical protein
MVTRLGFFLAWLVAEGRNPVEVGYYELYQKSNAASHDKKPLTAGFIQRMHYKFSISGTRRFYILTLLFGDDSTVPAPLPPAAEGQLVTTHNY